MRSPQLKWNNALDSWSFVNRRRAIACRSLLLWSIVVVLFFTTACDQSTTGNVGPVAQSVAHLPSFSDWRALYLGGNSTLHAVTLDGKTDIAGPTLPALDQTGLDFGSGGVSPDGHTLAYAGPNLTLFDLTGRSAAHTFADIAAIPTLFWFRDSSKLVLTDNAGNIWVATSTSTHPVPIPGGPFATRSILDGWLDATHLAVSGYGPQATQDTDHPTNFYLDSLDITTGTLHPITTITDPGLGIGRLFISADGSRAFFTNSAYRDAPFTPLLAEIDTSTGTITTLSNMTKTTGANFTTVAWKAGSQTIAASTGFNENNNLKVWLLDLDHDTATHVLDGQYCEQWSPDATTLITSTGINTVIDKGPYTINAVTFTADGKPSQKILTQGAMSFPFVGFAKTQHN